MSSLLYRPEIDGLRAIAVLAVLLCHAGITGFSGGYVGVDVFFVISGFLITSLIVKDLQHGTFSFIHFWERRCRRILPPLAIVILATFAAGWFLYLPADFDLLGQQMATQAVFASNILFKMQEGYFDVSSQTKPLLHTWSLAVEEQFYLVFPIVAYFTWKYRCEKVTRYLWICGIITFIGAAFIVRNSPSSAFYLLPFRAWELLLGSLLAVRPLEKKLSVRASEILSCAGLAGIFLPVLFYNDDTMFPGLAALPPCLGTAAIILSNTHQKTFVGRMLSLRGPVFIGLISYSLYLWHWPILAYVRYSQLFEFTTIVAAMCMVAAIILAILTWHFIEKPVRSRRLLTSKKQVFMASFIFLLFTGMSGLAVHLSKGVPQRLSAEIVQLADGALDINPRRAECNKPDFSRFDNDTICQTNPGSNITPTFILWGDSMGEAISPLFDVLSKAHQKNGYVAVTHGCPPILGYAQSQETGFDCPGFNKRVLDLIDRKNIKTIFLVANWSDHFKDYNMNYSFEDMVWFDQYKSFSDNPRIAAIRLTLDELGKRGIQIYFVTDPPYAAFDPPRFLAMKRLYHQSNIPETSDLNGIVSGFSGMKKYTGMIKDKHITFLDPLPYFCDEHKCHYSDGRQSYYYNANHLSVYGALRLRPLIEPYFLNGENHD